MCLRLETFGSQGFDVLDTAGHIKYPLTFPAAKMVMMPFAGGFIAGGFARDLDGADDAFFVEAVERTIDCGDANGRHLFGSALENFLRRKRSGGFCKDLTNYFGLAGLPDHFGI